MGSIHIGQCFGNYLFKSQQFDCGQVLVVVVDHAESERSLRFGLCHILFEGINSNIIDILSLLK